MLPKGAFHPGKPLLPHSGSCFWDIPKSTPIPRHTGMASWPNLPKGQGDVGWLRAHGSIPAPPSRTSLGHQWDTKWGHLSWCPGGNTGRAGCPQIRVGAMQPCPGAMPSALKTQCSLIFHPHPAALLSPAVPSSLLPSKDRLTASCTLNTHHLQGRPEGKVTPVVRPRHGTEHPSGHPAPG